MARLLLIVALLAVMFWVYSVVDCAVQPQIRHRGVPKAVWIVIVVVFPVVGGVLWFTLGRMSARAPLGAPDDDPEFLRRLGSESDQDERIRHLEEELARLDAETDDPATGSGRRSGTDTGRRGRSDPDAEHRTRPDPDAEHRTRPDPDAERRSRPDPDAGQTDRGTR